MLHALKRPDIHNKFKEPDMNEDDNLKIYE
jgi:hypothetical protein